MRIVILHSMDSQMTDIGDPFNFDSYHFANTFALCVVFHIRKIKIIMSLMLYSIWHIT